MTASNVLSFSRILLAIPILYFLSFNTPAFNWVAFIIGLIAVATDYFDGWLARRYGTVSTLGKYLDPVADKLLVGSLAVHLAFFRGNLPSWFAAVIVGKDALILVGGLVLLLKKIVVQADGPGKYTVSIVSLVFICFIFNLNTLGEWVLAAAVLFVLYSSYFYYLKFLILLKKNSSLFCRAVLPLLVLIPGLGLAIRAYFF